MRTFLRSLAGLAAGLGVALVCAVAVEGFSAVVHPFPPHFDGNVAAHVTRYPAWVLGVVVPAWGGAAAAAIWIAARIGGRVSGSLVALLLAGALAFNLAMLPYAVWFKVAMPLAFIVACLMGLRRGPRS